MGLGDASAAQGGSSVSGGFNICDWRFDCLAAGRLSPQPLSDVGFLMLAPLCVEMSAALALVPSPVPSPPHGGSLTEGAAAALTAATCWSLNNNPTNAGNAAAGGGGPSPSPSPPSTAAAAGVCTSTGERGTFGTSLPTEKIEVCVRRFLRAVESKYCLVPYHNSVHGLMVRAPQQQTCGRGRESFEEELPLPSPPPKRNSLFVSGRFMVSACRWLKRRTPCCT